MSIDLRLGRWEEALADVREVDAVISDPPYSARTQGGHRGGARLANLSDYERADGRKEIGAYHRRRRSIPYTHWTAGDVDAFVDAWAARNRGWFVCLSDHHLCRHYEAAYERHGLTAFAPVAVFIPGMTCRMSGDGPSSWTIYANVARPKKLSKWGTLPGGYTGGPGERVHIGGKPLWLMRALVRDYSRAGDLIVDPCAGAATTLIAAGIETRRAVGCEVDPETHTLAAERIRKGYTPSLFDASAPRAVEQTTLALALDAPPKDET